MNLQLVFFILLLSIALVATACGWLAVAQIRHSGGRLHGMGLALFAALLFPLLALDGLLLRTALSVLKACLSLNEILNGIRGMPGHVTGWMTGIQVCLGLGFLAFVISLNVAIVGRSWRWAVRPLGNTAPQAQSRFQYRGLGIKLLALLGLFMMATIFLDLFNHRPTPLADSECQIFIADAAKAGELLGTEPLDSPVNLNADEFQQFLRQTRIPDSTSLTLKRFLDSSSRSWSLSGDGLTINGRGKTRLNHGSKGITLALDYDLMASSAKGKQQKPLHYDGPACFSGVQTFLLPLDLPDQRKGYLILGIRIDRKELDTPKAEVAIDGDHAVYYAHDQGALKFAILVPSIAYKGFSGGEYRRRIPYVQGWQCDWTIDLPGKQETAIRYDAMSPGLLKIGTREFNLHDGSLLSIDQDGRIEQLPVFPMVETAKDPKAVRRIVAARSRFQSPAMAQGQKEFGSVRIRSLNLESSDHGFDFDRGTTVSAGPESKFLRMDDSRKKTLETWGVDFWTLNLTSTSLGEPSNTLMTAICDETGQRPFQAPWKGFLLYGCIAVPVDNLEWDAMTADETVARIAAATPAEITQAMCTERPPRTWLFKTREGGIGLLQATDFLESDSPWVQTKNKGSFYTTPTGGIGYQSDKGFVPSPKVAKFRYKMVAPKAEAKEQRSKGTE